MVVEIAVTLGPDGTVKTVNYADTSQMSDPVYRATAEAAARALWKCQKLDLPLDKYETWKSTTFRFHPNGFIG
jgi:hypothetical protein